MNMLPPAIAIFSSLLKEKGNKIEVFDTTYYAVDFGIDASGVHFELTPEDVTECVGDLYNIKQSNIHQKYETACDPRLNKKQSLDIAFSINELSKG